MHLISNFIFSFLVTNYIFSTRLLLELWEELRSCYITIALFPIKFQFNVLFQEHKSGGQLFSEILNLRLQFVSHEPEG